MEKEITELVAQKAAAEHAALEAEKLKLQEEKKAIELLAQKADAERAALEAEKVKLLEKQAAVLLADNPKELDSATRTKVLALMASENCLRKAIAAGALAEADLDKMRGELLTTMDMSAEQYDKLQAKLDGNLEPTDIEMLQAFMEKMCPAAEAPAADTGEAYWVKSCQYAVDMMEVQMGGDSSVEEMARTKKRISRRCLKDLKKVHPAKADKIAACVLSITEVDDLEACGF